MEKFGDRKKAFLGAIIAGISAIAGIASSASAANKQKEAIKSQELQERQQAGYKAAESMNKSFANTEYIDDFRDRFTFALGGNVRPNKYNDTKPAVNFQDRAPKFRIGGFVR